MSMPKTATTPAKTTQHCCGGFFNNRINTRTHARTHGDISLLRDTGCGNNPCCATGGHRNRKGHRNWDNGAPTWLWNTSETKAAPKAAPTRLRMRAASSEPVSPLSSSATLMLTMAAVVVLTRRVVWSCQAHARVFFSAKRNVVGGRRAVGKHTRGFSVQGRRTKQRCGV